MVVFSPAKINTLKSRETSDMVNVLVVSRDRQLVREISSNPGLSDMLIQVAADMTFASELIASEPPGLILIDADETDTRQGLIELVSGPGLGRPIPIIILLTEAASASLDNSLKIADFLLKPLRPTEVVMRLRRAAMQTKPVPDSEVIRNGELVIDLARCEVLVSGRILMLTYKEYELLKFLVANPGRVHSREALLNKVWGYDYFGGERTVDVHIRRLRGKLEETGHDYIETVRNMGYRFNENA